MSAKSSRPNNPVVVLREAPSSLGRYMILMMPAVLGSLLFHGGLIAAFLGYVALSEKKAEEAKQAAAKDRDDDKPGATPDKKDPKKDDKQLDKMTPIIQADEFENPPEPDDPPPPVVEVPPEVFPPSTDPKFDPDLPDPQEFVPGKVVRDTTIYIPGKEAADKYVKERPDNGPALPGQIGGEPTLPGDYFKKGPDAAPAIEVPGIGNSPLPIGPAGSSTPGGGLAPGNIFGRLGPAREQLLRSGGGTDESEKAVTRGLQWLVRNQKQNGSWWLTNKSGTSIGASLEARPVAATALGLLPFLAAGKTHQNLNRDNPYAANVERGLRFLISQQAKHANDKKLKGYFGRTMYDHGLATIALCEAYALTKDRWLLKPAQDAVDLIMRQQTADSGGWGYTPDNNNNPHKDMSISGWQIMALKSAEMAGLDVPPIAKKRAIHFMELCAKPDGGFKYSPPGDAGQGSPRRMTAVGLLCRQYMQELGPSDQSMQKGISTYLLANPPGVKDVYYYYYATQVMHHFGGEDWRNWNEKMREYLIRTQDVSKSDDNGSWSEMDDEGIGTKVGGRLMITSLNLLTLEVYYRYLPLYNRDSGYSAQMPVKNAMEK